MKRLPVVLLVLAMAASGCDETPTEPTTPFTPTAFSETFAGTITVGGSRFYSFDVFQGGTVTLMFGSLRPTGSDTPLSLPMTIGIGIPQGTGCNVPLTATVTPGLTYQVANSLSQGTYCVNISDPGSLTGPADFAVRIVQNPSDTVAGEPGTSIFRSDLTVGGAATRTFPATKAGTIVARLDSLGPPDGVVARLGLGLPTADGSGACNVTFSIVASAPAEISAGVVAGTYCVRISDAGSFTETATFSISIIRP